MINRLPEKPMSHPYCLRQVPLEIVPIAEPATHDLAIIASVRHETPDDLTRYAEYIRDEFKTNRPRLQVLFCDNTPDSRLRSVLSTMSKVLSDEVDFQPLTKPLPGKVHGLNACLKQVRADFVMPVDPNKHPAPGTMCGLYQRISSTDKIDLLSARVASNPNRGVPIQYYNSGAIHIGRRWCFSGFPEILNDDGYTMRVVKIRQGVFKVAYDLTVSRREENIKPQQRAKKQARWIVGDKQLDYLTVIDGQNNQYSLDGLRGSLQEELKKINGLLTVFRHIINIPMREKLRLPMIVLSRGLSDSAGSKLLQQYIEEYEALLSADPNLCAWADYPEQF